MHTFTDAAETGAACQQLDLVGNDKRGVETHTELTDQRGILALVAGQLRQELARA